VRLAPSFAGSFYPSDPEELQHMVDAYLVAVSDESTAGEGLLRGGVVPHAGYVYSGQCAAHLYTMLARREPDTVVLMGPSHRVHVEGAALFDLDGFETPLGPVASNRRLAERLAAQVENLHLTSPFAEHSLEVQLPFLRRAVPRSQVVAVAFGMADLDLSKRLAASLSELSAQEDIVVVASSDLSHFHRRDRARRLDARFAERLSALAVDELWEDLLTGETEACGSGAVLALLEFARSNGDEMKLLDLRDSAAVTGSEDDVVGYLSAAALEAGPA